MVSKADQDALGFRKSQPGTKVAYAPSVARKRVAAMTSAQQEAQTKTMFHSVLTMRQDWALADRLTAVINWTKNFARYCGAREDGPCPRTLHELEGKTSILHVYIPSISIARAYVYSDGFAVCIFRHGVPCREQVVRGRRLPRGRPYVIIDWTLVSTADVHLAPRKYN